MNKILPIIAFAACIFACSPPSENNSESTQDAPVVNNSDNLENTPLESSDPSTSPSGLTQPQTIQPQTLQPQAIPPTQSADASSLKSLPPERKAHYTCPEFHSGSGSENPGTCPTCGKEYVHNDVYHQIQNQSAPQTITVDPNQPTLNAPPIQMQAPTQAGKGFHYICPDGHPGGAEGAGKCASCGKDLVHNDKFH